MKQICPLCNGTLIRKRMPYAAHGIKLGVFPADVCSKCGEQWFNEQTSRKIEAEEKKKGVFGLSKDTKISYSGNALTIRIPKALAEFLHLKKETPITLVPSGRNKLTVEIKE